MNTSFSGSSQDYVETEKRMTEKTHSMKNIRLIPRLCGKIPHYCSDRISSFTGRKNLSHGTVHEPTDIDG